MTKIQRKPEDYYPEYKKNSYSSTIGTQTTQLKITKRSEQRLHKEEIGMGNKHRKRCSTSLVSREMKNKTTTRYCHVPQEWMKLKNG